VRQGFPMRGNSQLIPRRYGSPLDGIRSIAFERAYLEYSNAGNILSPSFVPPGSTILLSSNLRPS